MNGESFVTLASKMILLHDDQAARRTVVSRSYFGAFHSAIALLHDLSVLVDANHGHLWMDLANADHPVAHSIARELRELHSHRVVADYRLDDALAPTSGFAKECVESAQRTVQMVQHLRRDLQATETKNSFIAAISSFRARVGRRI